MSKRNTHELSKDDVISIDSGKIEFSSDQDFNQGLLLIHAEWCGHCKQLMPKFEYLSKTFRDIKNTNQLNGKPVNCKNIPELSSIEESSGINIKFVNGYPTIYKMDKPENSDENSSKIFILSPYGEGREIKDLIQPFIDTTTLEFTKN